MTGMAVALRHMSFFLPREPIDDFKLLLHGNKRNDRNEMYRRRLVDEVSFSEFYKKTLAFHKKDSSMIFHSLQKQNRLIVRKMMDFTQS